MSAVLGTAAVSLGLVGAVLGVVTLGLGLRRHDARLLHAGRRYAWVVATGALLATVAMEVALIRHDFSLKYVAEHGSRETPLLFTITTMWSALEGSILLWALVLAGYLVLMVRHFRDRVTDPLVAWATLTVFVVAAFFFLLMVGPANPFKVVSGTIPSDGPGPNPLLQNHPLVAFHPPMLYLGYVGFTIPFAFAVAALVTGRLGEGWLIETRRWTLFAWGFLTVGIVLGAWWSYEVLGWGGYWAWDPVENASFLPWLTATAYVHSVMVQERRGMLRVWNLSLLLATFSLTILGTFLTRSGVLDSVHAFTESAIGPMILGFFGLTVAVGVGLIGWRGDRLSVGGPYFDRMTMPVGFLLLFLMAVAPALPWRKASGEVLRQRLLWPAWAATITAVVVVALGYRGPAALLAFTLGAFAATAALRQLVLSARRSRAQGSGAWRGLIGRANGGMVVHLGVVLIAVAFAASHAYRASGEFRLTPGRSAEVAGHRVTYLGTTQVTHSNKTSMEARVRIDGGKVFSPALHEFPFATQAIGSPSVKTGLLEDVYLTLVAAPEQGSRTATIGVVVQPLIAWLWIGGGLMGVGTFLAAWPGRRRRRPTSPASAPVPDERLLEPAVVG